MDSLFDNKPLLVGTLFFILILICVIHELIHGLFFSMLAEGKFKSVKFGIMPAKKLFSFYCQCKEKLRLNQYRIAIIMPLIITGIIPAIVSILIGDNLLFSWSIICILLAGDDILILLKTSKEKKNVWIFDHPTKGGYYVYRELKDYNGGT